MPHHGGDPGKGSRSRRERAARLEGMEATSKEIFEKAIPEQQPDESLPRMPDHYKIHGLKSTDPATGLDRDIEVMDITDALTNHTEDGCNGNRFCMLKYILRAGRKPGVPYEKDMRKAFWCVVRELQRLGMNPQAMLNNAEKEDETPKPKFGAAAGQIWCVPLGGGFVDRSVCEICHQSSICKNLKCADSMKPGGHNQL